MSYQSAPMFEGIYNQIAERLLEAPVVKVGKWHQMDVANNRLLDTPEITGSAFTLPVSSSMVLLQRDINPNLPWAEDHFKERVSGVPYNPPPSNEWWPYAMTGNALHKKDEKFSHAYPERMWPKRAGMALGGAQRQPDNRGIRYGYGDLNDLVDLLIKEPMTRQAYLPIWFPEDINAANIGERVPCTLGYHFMLRPPKFTVTYLIRSCDFVRHFRDDVYMAARLLQYVATRCMAECPVGNMWGEEFLGNDIYPNLELVFHAMSLHCMVGDLPKIRKELNASPKS